MRRLLRLRRPQAGADGADEIYGHNTAHANELAQLAKQLQDLGENAAYEQIMLAVSDFEKGNLRLSTVLTSMNG